MDYATYSDAELRRLIASAPVPNEAANLEAIRRFIDQGEMFDEEELEDEKRMSYDAGYDRGLSDAEERL